MSGESEPETDELRELGSSREVDPVERARARARAHAKLFGAVGEPMPLRVDRYELREKAGSGGLGTVWKAYDPKLDREVAIKLLRPDKLRAGHRARAQLMAEASLMARLTHPNVVRVYDLGEARLPGDEGEPQIYVAMEFVDGMTLRGWQQAHRPGVDELLAVYRQAGAGLLAAHEAGLVHGDFKPDNVLVDGRGRVLVTDFAVTRNILQSHLEDELSTLEWPSESARSDRVFESLAAVVIGTPAYMAPEQLDGEVPDTRSDQFGFCVALWEALTGERPFPGRTFAALRESIAEGPPRFPAGVGTARLRAVLARGLAEEPRDRYPSLQALLSELERSDEHPGRRWAVPAASVLAVGLGAVLVVPQLLAVDSAVDSVERRGEAPSCAHEAERAGAAVWSDAQIEVLEAHWRTIPADAPHAFPPVAAKLDAWIQAWREASASACNEHQADALTDAGLRLRRACLDRRLQSFAALVELLAKTDAKALARVDEALAALPELDDCSDPKRPAVLSEEPSFDDPEQARALAGARTQLDRAGYLSSLHEFEQALTQLEPARATAEALGWDAGLARALALRGAARLALGQTRPGEDDLFQATVAARRAGRPDIEARALLELALAALDGGSQHEAKRWIELADTAIAAADDRNLAVRLAVVRALLAAEQRGHAGLEIADLDEDPLVYLDEALALVEARAGGRQSPLFAALSSQRGFVHLDRKQAHLALADFEAAAAVAEVEPGVSARVELGLARARQALGRPGAAAELEGLREREGLE